MSLPEADQVAALATHPRIGEPSEEQRGAEPEVLAELARLNDEYERRFGFEFVVFVERPHPGRAAAGAARAARAHARRGARDRAAGALRDREGPVDADYLRDLADLVLRMLHVVAGIAWIGASFYFIRLDLGLAPPKEPKEGVAGEYWGVHGGGFYHSQKYKVAPPQLPEHLHWFKWEAYTTWLSGFALLVVLYWLDADTRLIDPTVADLSAWQAVALSAGGLALGWLIYDLACRLLIEDRLVAIAVIALVAVSAFAAGELFARARGLPPGRRDARDDHGGERLLRDHPGALGADPREAGGARAGPRAGLRAKQRSVHNNYLTLPVVFTMLAGHFPLAFGQRPCVARPARDLRGRRGDPALLQPLAHGQAATGGSWPRRGWRRPRSRSCWRRTTSTRRRRRTTSSPRRSSSTAVRHATPGSRPARRSARRTPSRCRNTRTRSWGWSSPA